MDRLLTLAAGRRAKWAVLAAWVAVAALVLGLGLPAKFQAVQKNEPSSFLPGGAESVRALELDKRFASGESFPAVIVFRRASGLQPADLARIARTRTALERDPPVTAAGARVPAALSPDRTGALLFVALSPRGQNDLLAKAVDQITARVGPSAGGLEVGITGPAGYSRDGVRVFESINGALLYASFGLVIVLLILIYRSPVFWVLPLLAVAFAELASRGLGYGVARAGVTINGQSAGILSVLVLGAGTDYALLLVARYREELREHADHHEAMALALRRAGPAILASGLTVILALLCLFLAQVNGTKGLGPTGAIGIALAVLSMLTLLPALLLAGGRRAFWPFVPHHGSVGADATHGGWRRVAEAVGRRPRPVWLAAVAVLGVLCVGLTSLRINLPDNQDYRGGVASVQGQRLLAASFPSGAAAPADVIVQRVERLGAVRAALARAPGVARLGPVERGAPGARFDLLLVADPYSKQARAQIPALRDVAREAGGPTTLVGGPTAAEYDLGRSAARDNRLLVPLVLLVVFCVLALLLRALLLAALLVATVILSFAASLGAGAFVFTHLLGYPGAFTTLPLLAFIFLVALGVDYNIFLMARVREEALRRGTHDGIARGLAVTGGVITSAGLVLAGTFAALIVLPLKSLTEIGFTIAFGVLLDTFLVRSLLVPALSFDLGRRIWWPSALARGRREAG